MQKFINRHTNFGESIEITNFRDSGGESNVYSVLMKQKLNKEEFKKKAVLKLILSHKRQMHKKDEIKISSKLKHQNIISCYMWSKTNDNDSLLMLMEESKYGNIRNFQKNIFKRYALSETMICFLAYQILNGLKYCHQCKVAHMDIKFQNIVIDEFLNAKLIDFSISLDYSGKNPNEKFKLPSIGTNFFMSKELFESQKIK